MALSVNLPPQRPREIGVHTAAKILGLSMEWVRAMCREGQFKTANRPGMGKTPHWKIAYEEVIVRKLNPNTNRKD